MKKQYVKTDKGVLVLATAEQIADAAVIKFDVEFPDPEPPMADPIKELTGLIRDMSNDVKSRADEFKEQLEAFKEFGKRGLPISDPTADALKFSMDPAEYKSIFGRYDAAKQGKILMDKVVHPTHVIDEATRIEMAKFFCLFIRSEIGKDYRARAKFEELYADEIARKTPLGDSPNLFPLPDIVDAEIFFFAREASVALQYCRTWEMTSDKQSFPAENAAVSVGWGNTTPNYEPGITEVELEANELSAYSVIRNTTIADARSDVVGWLAGALAEAAGQEIDNQVFNGSGSPFTGLLGASGSGYSVILGGSLFADLDADDLSSMIAKLDGLKKQGARFFMNGQVIHLVRTLKDDQNRPIFMETVGSPVPGTIYGFPFSEVIKMTGTTAANTAFIVFGNLRYYAIGRRLDTTALSVDPYGLWTTNRTRFKLYQRWGAKVALANGFVRALTTS